MRATIRKKIKDLATRNSTDSSVAPTVPPQVTQAQQATSDGAKLNSTEQLWNEAYDSLKKDESKLMNAYELLLAKELGGDINGNVIAANASDRRVQMQQVIDRGLAKTEREATKKKSVGDVVQVLNSIKDVVATGVKSSSEATIAWTALTAALPLITNVSDQSAQHRGGIAKVRDILLKTDAIAPYRLESGDLNEAQDILRATLMTLYRKILLFLIQAACYCGQSRTGHILKDAIKLNDWGQRLKGIQDAEKAVLDLDLDIKAQRTAIFEKTILTERRDEKDDACLAKIRLSDPRQDKKRIEDTKGGLLKESYSWILGTNEFDTWREDGGLLWLKGDPGKGKTMLLCGIIDELHGKQAYFFFQATNKNINTSTAAMRGLIYMMADENAHLIALVRKRLDKYNDVFDANSWYTLSEIFEEMISLMKDIHIIIDALDECIEGRQDLMRLILRNRTKAKWVVSSRNHSDIEEELSRSPSLSLEINSSSVSQAVDCYIQYKVNQLAKQKSYNPETKSFVLDYLRQNAHGTFLWVALVCTNLAQTQQWLVRSILKKFPPGLNEVYLRMWDTVIEKDDDTELLQRILTTCALVLRPLSLKELRVVADIPNEAAAILADVLQDCGSFLTIRQDTLEFVHQSAKEFIDGRTRDVTQKVHLEIFSRSMSAMFRILQKDMYKLEAPDSSISQIRVPNPDPLAEVNYSCIYWIHHLVDGKRLVPQDDRRLSAFEENLVRQFLTYSYLPWLEATSLLKATAPTLMMVYDLENLITKFYRPDDAGKTSTTDLRALIYDARRFFQYFRSILQDFPLQIYYAGILFSPKNSMLQKSFSKDGPSDVRVAKHVSIEWSASLVKLGLRPDYYFAQMVAICFSHDTRQLAISYNDGLVQIRQVVSMETIQEKYIGRTESWDFDLIKCLAFTHNHDRVICYHETGAVTLWDLSSNQFVKLSLVSVVGISPDGHFVAQVTSTSVRLHRILENESCFYKDMDVAPYMPQDLHDEDVYRVELKQVSTLVFSSDSNGIAVRTSIYTIAVWDINPAHLRCEASITGYRSYTMTLGTKFLGVCGVSIDGAKFSALATLSLYDINNGCMMWTNHLNSPTGYGRLPIQINISSKDDFITMSYALSCVFDSMSGACVWRSARHVYSWLSPNLQYVLSFDQSRSSEPKVDAVTLQEWFKPESGAVINVKKDPPEEQISSISINGHHVSTNGSSEEDGYRIMNLENNTILDLGTKKQYELSDSMQLAVVKDAQKANPEISELQSYGIRTVSPTFSNDERVIFISIAPDDSHIALMMESGIIKIWNVSSQMEMQSVECKLSPLEWSIPIIRWSRGSRKVQVSTASKFVVIDLEGYGSVLRVDGARHLAFSQNALSFIMRINDITRFSVDADEENIAAYNKTQFNNGDLPFSSRVSMDDDESAGNNDGSVISNVKSDLGQNPPGKVFFSREWSANDRLKVGDWIHWDSARRTGQVIEGLRPQSKWDLNHRSINALCYNSQILVTSVLEENFTYSNNSGYSGNITHLEVWNWISKQLLVESYLPADLSWAEMDLEDSVVHFGCGAVSIGPKDISLGTTDQMFFDGEWIWKRGKRLVCVPAEFRKFNGARSGNKMLGLNRDKDGYIVLKIL